jgi:hypothetical protein
MAKLIIETRKDGTTNAFFGRKIWKRIYEHDSDSEFRWHEVVSSENGYKRVRTPLNLDALLEKAYTSGDYAQTIRRFPHLPVPDRINDVSDIPSVREVKDTATRWLVDGLIPRGSLVLLTAPPAGYKTWLALALAGAVSTGADFLGRTTVKTPVLYLDRENRLSVIRNRLDMLNVDDGGPLTIWGRWLKDKPPLIGDPRLIEFARRGRPLIIFDSLVRFHSAQENNATQMAEVSESFMQLTDAGATVAVSHHQGKTPGMKYRGSTDILAGVDVAFAISKKKTKERTILTLDCYKHRDVQEFELTLRPDLENGRFEVVDDPSAALLSATIEGIKSAITRNPGLSQNELLEKADLPETKGRKILQEHDGVHWDSSRGKGKALHYYPNPVVSQRFASCLS